MENKPGEDHTERGIEGIAHHFLSGITNRPTAPQREGPKVDLPLSSEPDREKAEKRVDLHTEFSSLTTMAVFADHLDDSQKKVSHFVQQMVVEEGPMALLDLTDATTVQLSELRAEKFKTSELELLDDSINTAWQELFGGKAKLSSSDRCVDEDFFRLVQGLPDKVEMLAMHFPRQLDEDSQRILQTVDQIVLLSGCQQDQLLKTYQLIKRLMTSVEGAPISLFFFGQKNEEEAVATYEKLAETCKEFLGGQIEWAGCEQSVPTCEVKLRVANRNNATMKLFEKNKISLFEKSEKSNEKVVTKQAPNVKKPLAVTVLPTNDQMLTRELAQQSNSWLDIEGLQVLEFPLPEGFDSPMAVLADGTGKLYVLMAGLGKSEAYLHQAMWGRGWLRKNFRLIQGYCRESSISDEDEIGIILVGNCPDGRIKEVREQLNFTCLVRQVYLLETEAFKGLLVV